MNTFIFCISLTLLYNSPLTFYNLSNYISHEEFFFTQISRQTDILASGNLNSRNVETGVPEHGNRLDWLNGYLSGATHLSSPEPLCGAKQALQLS